MMAATIKIKINVSLTDQKHKQNASEVLLYAAIVNFSLFSSS